MSDAQQTDTTEKPEGDAAGKKAPGLGVLVAIALVGAALGGGVGGFVIVPRLLATTGAEKPASGEQAHGEEGDAEESKEHGGDAKEGEHGAEQGGKLFKLDNLIVNPAGSQGARFLMTTVAIETVGEETEARLKAREIEVRDRVLSVLERKTLEQLTQPSARDSLKKEIAAALAPTVGKKARLRVYLPQFVIQ